MLFTALEAGTVDAVPEGATEANLCAGAGTAAFLLPPQTPLTIDFAAVERKPKRDLAAGFGGGLTKTIDTGQQREYSCFK